jgi:hypothetical protein
MDGNGSAGSLSDAVLREVAEAEGVSPEALNPPLFDVVDPDALDSVFNAETGRVSFEYHGYWVTVDHAGSVSVEPMG